MRKFVNLATVFIRLLSRLPQLCPCTIDERALDSLWLARSLVSVAVSILWMLMKRYISEDVGEGYLLL